MTAKKDDVSAIMINEDQLFVCAGSPSTVYGNITEIYDFINKSWINLAKMNHKRYKAGICMNEYKANVYVGCGRRASLKFECYDIIINIKQ